MQITILHISTGMSFRGGDSQMLTTVELLKDLSDQQHHVFCAQGSIIEQKCIEKNIAYTSVKRGRKFSISYMRNIVKTAKKLNVTAIHAHDSNSQTMSLWAIRSLKNTKLIFSRKRNNRIGSSFFKKLKYNSKNIDHIICVSNAVKRVLLPAVKDHSKIKVIYDGIDVDRFKQESHSDYLHKELGLSPKVKIIGNIAGLVPQKDLFTFIRAIKSFTEKSDIPVKFVVAGDGPLRDELVAFAEAENVSQHIIFLGFRTDIPELLQSFDVFMLSSKTEGLPLVVMEAFAAKTPVVATDAGGTNEAVKNNENGFIVPVEDADALATKTLEILENTELAAQFTERSSRLVHEQFTLKVMQENYKNFYRSLLN